MKEYQLIGRHIHYMLDPYEAPLSATITDTWGKGIAIFYERADGSVGNSRIALSLYGSYWDFA